MISAQPVSRILRRARHCESLERYDVYNANIMHMQLVHTRIRVSTPPVGRLCTDLNSSGPCGDEPLSTEGRVRLGHNTSAKSATVLTCYEPIVRRASFPWAGCIGLNRGLLYQESRAHSEMACQASLRGSLPKSTNLNSIRDERAYHLEAVNSAVPVPFYSNRTLVYL